MLTKVKYVFIIIIGTCFRCVSGNPIGILMFNIRVAIKYHVTYIIVHYCVFYKKKQLDVNDLSSYRPISQLPLTTKILERHVTMTMRRYLDDHGINDMFQSAYRPNHSTETALVKIFNYISLALGTGKKVVLCLLDLSAAFDTLKHSVLIDRLREIGLQDKALEWFQLYLSDRRMTVKIKEHVSELQVVKYGVPQGSVLGPMLFNVVLGK